LGTLIERPRLDSKDPTFDGCPSEILGRQRRLQPFGQASVPICQLELFSDNEGVVLVGGPSDRYRPAIPEAWIDLDYGRPPCGDVPSVEWPEMRRRLTFSPQVAQPGKARVCRGSNLSVHAEAED
jgi:hypothetical protein